MSRDCVRRQELPSVCNENNLRELWENSGDVHHLLHTSWIEGSKDYWSVSADSHCKRGNDGMIYRLRIDDYIEVFLKFVNVHSTR